MLQAVADLHEQHLSLVTGSIKTLLDPRKLSTGAAAGSEFANAPGGARPTHGGAAAKQQVSSYVAVQMLLLSGCIHNNNHGKPIQHASQHLKPCLL